MQKRLSGSVHHSSTNVTSPTCERPVVCGTGSVFEGEIDRLSDDQDQLSMLPTLKGNMKSPDRRRHCRSRRESALKSHVGHGPSAVRRSLLLGRGLLEVGAAIPPSPKPQTLQPPPFGTTVRNGKGDRQYSESSTRIRTERDTCKEKILRSLLCQIAKGVELLSLLEKEG